MPRRAGSILSLCSPRHLRNPHPYMPNIERIVDMDIIQRRATAAANLLKVLANENRLLLLCELHKGEKSVGKLNEALGLEQSRLSQYLACLRQHNMVKTRREGTTIFYALAKHPAQQLLRVLCHIYEH
jgi:DNA-binding transcriptional ArsR family regulator